MHAAENHHEGQEYDPYTTLFASKKQREDYSADAASSRRRCTSSGFSA